MSPAKSTCFFILLCIWGWSCGTVLANRIQMEVFWEDCCFPETGTRASCSSCGNKARLGCAAAFLHHKVINTREGLYELQVTEHRKLPHGCSAPAMDSPPADFPLWEENMNFFVYMYIYIYIYLFLYAYICFKALFYRAVLHSQ